MDYLQREKARLLSEKEYKTDMELFNASSISKLSIEDLDDVVIFDNVNDFNNYLIEMGEIPDCAMIDFDLYSFEACDINGKEVSYASIDANKRLVLNTNDRHGQKDGFKGVNFLDNGPLGHTRNDTSYASVKHLSAGRLKETEIDNEYIRPLQEGKISVFGFEDIKGKYFEVVFDKEEAGLKLHPTGEYVSVNDLESRINKVITVDGDVVVEKEMITTAHNKDVGLEKKNRTKYAIVADRGEKRTETFEDYDDKETAEAAFEHIRKKGFHISEYGEIVQLGKDIISLSMDAVVSTESGEFIEFIDVVHTPIFLNNLSVSTDVLAMSDEQRKSALDEIEGKSDRNIDLTQ